MCLMRTWAMIGRGDRRIRFTSAQMRSHPHAAMVNLNRRGRGANLNALARQVVRHAVEAALKLDVIVDVDRGFAPDREIEACSWQRPQRRLIQLFEQRPTATFTFSE